MGAGVYRCEELAAADEEVVRVGHVLAVLDRAGAPQRTAGVELGRPEHAGARLDAEASQAAPGGFTRIVGKNSSLRCYRR